MATRAQGLTQEVAAAASQIQRPPLALMLYGSYARGDADAASDIDLLQVVPQPARSYIMASATVVSYTVDQLRAMSRSGSLFAWHLRTEGIVLNDSNHLLSAVLDEHPGPASDGTLRRVRQLAVVLDVPRREFDLHGPRILRTARYLLRSAIYARSLAAGETSFAIRSAAKAAGAEAYLPLVARDGAQVDWSSLESYRHALVHVLGAPLAANRYGSLEALAVNAWDADRQLATTAVQVLSNQSGELDYAMIGPTTL